MGIYCSLYIGSTEFSWKGIIPDFVALLFDSTDYTASLLDEGEEWYEHKFISSCGVATKRLQKIGINLDFLRKLHFNYFVFDFDEFKGSLEYRCEQYLLRKYCEITNLDHRIKRMVELCISLYFNRLNEEEEFMKVVGAHRCQGKARQHLEEALSRIESNTQLQNSPEQKV